MKLQRTTWLCVAVILVGLLSASGLNQKLLRQREAHGLVLSGSLEGAPPHVVFTTVALGGFRGLLAEMVDEHAADMGADSSCYCKVKFQVDGKQEYRIDINGAAGATNLSNAWAA